MQTQLELIGTSPVQSELIGSPILHGTSLHGQTPNLWVPIDGSSDFGGYDVNMDFDFVAQSGGYQGAQQSFDSSIKELASMVVGYEQVSNGNVHTEILVLRDEKSTMEWTLTIARDSTSANDSGMITTKGADGASGPSYAWKFDQGVYDAFITTPSGDSKQVLHVDAGHVNKLPPLGGN